MNYVSHPYLHYDLSWLHKKNQVSDLHKVTCQFTTKKNAIITAINFCSEKSFSHCIFIMATLYLCLVGWISAFLFCYFVHFHVSEYYQLTGIIFLKNIVKPSDCRALKGDLWEIRSQPEINSFFASCYKTLF